MKYRSIVCLISAFVSVILQIPAAKYWGAIGVALAIALVFLIQIVILTVYYHRIQHLDMIALIKSLLKQSLVPVALLTLFILISGFDQSWVIYFTSIIVFIALFSVLSWLFIMNDYERSLIKSYLLDIVKKHA